ncbi:MAG: CDP-glycerol glycerophosphotransferase family protein [Chitinophagaceae bacterium]
MLLDFFVSNRPILFYTPDFIEYASTQQLNYDYAEISSGEQFFNQENLLKRIEFYLGTELFCLKIIKKKISLTNTATQIVPIGFFKLSLIQTTCKLINTNKDLFNL